MKLLRLDLFPSEASEVLEACQRQDQEPALRWLAQELERQQRRCAKLATPNPLKPKVKRPNGSWRRPAGKRWGSKALRQVVWERSEGRCENSSCNARITWATFELDHFLGRARAPQRPENCWALCGTCHDRKHAGEPSRGWWLSCFHVHLIDHGFAKSETARKVVNALEAERLLEKASTIRARQQADPLNMGREPHDEKTVEAFYDGTLGPEERAAFERHLATCEECDRRLGELMEMSALMERRAAPGVVDG